MSQGVRIIRIEELFDRGIPDVMAEARQIVGSAETYCSFDIDFIDPSFAPGTGTPEIGGVTSFQAQQVVRELAGVNLIGRTWLKCHHRLMLQVALPGLAYRLCSN